MKEEEERREGERERETKRESSREGGEGKDAKRVDYCRGRRREERGVESSRRKRSFFFLFPLTRWGGGWEGRS